MKYYFALSFAWLASASAYGQLRFEAGPQLGLHVGLGDYHHMGRTYDTKLALNGQAGAAVSLGWRHWGLQASGLFAQKGIRVDDDYQPDTRFTNMLYVRSRQRYRFDYLTVPVNLVYHLRADGQGLQVFGGGYVSRLLGGRFRYDDVNVMMWDGAPLVYAGDGSRKVRAADVYEEDRERGRLYVRPWDAGVQAGLGYRHQRLLVQLGYTRSLRDLGPTYPYMGPNFRMEGPSYKLRGLQLTATYLLLGTKP
ncbi:hypothetical protein GCM10027048_19490 [Hymenobacter coalescens]